ncbi:MAG: hypothetical protein KDD62_12255, partial [Bdellovibrionales bacterium]|nr:hypothetical protein [Bdellovibrionales bacterium]
TECPLSSVVLREFEDTFSILVFTTFARPECGGVLSIFPQNLGYEAQRAWLVDQPIPSSGMVLDHVEIRFIDEFKYEVNQAIRGQLELRLAGMDEWIQTGLDGFYAEDNKDRRHIFIFGEHTDGILRFGHYINLARIDAVIRNLRGVAFGMAVGFSNSFAGLEVGAYMVPVRALAHEIDDHEWLAQLRLLLPYEECPKVIVRGAYPSVYGDWPTREEVLERFKKFRKIDYAKLNA